MITASRLALRWLCIFCWVACCQAASAETAERLVALKATISVRNNGDIPLAPYIHRLTIPANDHAQQRLLRIEYPYKDGYAIRPHDNGVDHYIKFKWEIPPRSQLIRDITFHLRLTPFDHALKPIPKSPGDHSGFLAPSEYVESDSAEIAEIAKAIRNSNASAAQQLLAAFRHPQKSLRYREIDNKGALFALRNGIGDCTEYAAVFIAIARALGIPARMTSEFRLSADDKSPSNSFSEPNHHAAEVYLDGAWIPADPNLALDPSLGYGFGRGAADKIVLKRGDSWVWSNSLPKTSKAYRDRHVEIGIRWSISTPQ